jgi:stage III sporulation protein AB
MLKLIGAALILFAGTLIGFQQAARFAARPRHIRALLHALQRLETEIGYGYTPLPEALERAGAHSPQPLAAMLKDAAELLGDEGGLSFRECWSRAIERHWAESAMRSPEKTALLRLGSSLGISDREDQVKHLRLAMQQLKAEEDAARDDQERYEKLCKSLGVLIAALIVILIV